MKVFYTLKSSIVYLKYASEMRLCMCSSLCTQSHSYIAKKILFHVVIENNRKFLYQWNSLVHECFLESSIPSRLVIFYGLIWIRGESITYLKFLTLFIAKEHLFLFYIIFYFEFRTMPINSISRVHLSHLYSI